MSKRALAPNPRAAAPRVDQKVEWPPAREATASLMMLESWSESTWFRTRLMCSGVYAMLKRKQTLVHKLSKVPFESALAKEALMLSKLLQIQYYTA